MNPRVPTSRQLGELKSELESLARARGFEALGVSDVALGADVTHFTRWLGEGMHGEMDYMWKHGTRRTHPEELVPGTVRVLSARMNYWPAEAHDAFGVLRDPHAAVSRGGPTARRAAIDLTCLPDLASDEQSAGFLILDEAIARLEGVDRPTGPPPRSTLQPASASP